MFSEISDDGVRGTLGSTLVLSENVGMLMAYCIGNYFDFYAIPKFAILVTIICAISLYFLPESPLFLLKQNKLLVSTECSFTVHRLKYSLHRKQKSQFDSIKTCAKLKEIVNYLTLKSVN